MTFNCPGTQKFRQPQPEMIKCPSCAEEVEIWTDEIRVICPKCKNMVMRRQGQSCLDWCRYAKRCVGNKIYNKYMQNKTISTKQKLIKR